jgi:entericidin B
MRALKLLAAAPRLVLPVLLLAGAVFSLTACNTMSGAGQDVSAGGKAVTNTADKVKEKM